MSTEILAWALTLFMAAIIFASWRALRNLNGKRERPSQKFKITQYASPTIDITTDPKDHNVIITQLGEQVHLDYANIPVFVSRLNEIWRTRGPMCCMNPECDEHIYPDFI